MGLSIVLSIRPPFVEAIIEGKKTFEYRRSIPRKEIDKILIYETAPVSMVVASTRIKQIICLPLDQLWLRTRRGSGISKEFFDRYFDGKESGYAYELEYVHVLENPLPLSHFGLAKAPQSFAYFKD